MPEIIENRINKRKRFPNQRYADVLKSASERSSDEASSSNETDDEIDKNRNSISKNRKKSKLLPEPEPIQLPANNNNIQSKLHKTNIFMFLINYRIF